MVAVSGTARLGTDYTLTVAGTAVVNSPFSVGVTEAGVVDVIAITATDDSTVEPAEMIVLTLQGGGTLLLGAVSRYEVSITDDDVPEVVTFASAATSTVSEGGAEALIPVMLNAVCLDGSDADADGNAGGAGLVGGEYTLPATLTIARGDDEATLRVLLTDDGIDETDETLTITFTADAAYSVGAQGTHVLTITDDDVPEVEFAMTSSTLAEDAGTSLTVTVNVSPVPVTALTVPVTVSGTAMITADYTLSVLMVSAGSATGSFTVTPVDDSAIEDAETAILTLGTGTGYELGADRVHTVTLTSEDTLPPQASFTDSDGGAIAENGGTAAPAITVLRPRPTRPTC